MENGHTSSPYKHRHTCRVEVRDLLRVTVDSPSHPHLSWSCDGSWWHPQRRWLCWCCSAELPRCRRPRPSASWSRLCQTRARFDFIQCIQAGGFQMSSYCALFWFYWSTYLSLISLSCLKEAEHQFIQTGPCLYLFWGGFLVLFSVYLTTVLLWSTLWLGLLKVLLLNQRNLLLVFEVKCNNLDFRGFSVVFETLFHRDEIVWSETYWVSWSNNYPLEAKLWMSLLAISSPSASHSDSLVHCV